MSTPQTAILPEHMTACIVIEANAVSTDMAKIKAACRQSLQRLQQQRGFEPRPL